MVLSCVFQDCIKVYLLSLFCISSSYLLNFLQYLCSFVDARRSRGIVSHITSNTFLFIQYLRISLFPSEKIMKIISPHNALTIEILFLWNKCNNSDRYWRTFPGDWRKILHKLRAAHYPRRGQHPSASSREMLWRWWCGSEINSGFRDERDFWVTWASDAPVILLSGDVTYYVSQSSSFLMTCPGISTV